MITRRVEPPVAVGQPAQREREHQPDHHRQHAEPGSACRTEVDDLARGGRGARSFDGGPGRLASVVRRVVRGAARAGLDRGRAPRAARDRAEQPAVVVDDDAAAGTARTARRRGRRAASRRRRGDGAAAVQQLAARRSRPSRLPASTQPSGSPSSSTTSTQPSRWPAGPASAGRRRAATVGSLASGRSRGGAEAERAVAAVAADEVGDEVVDRVRRAARPGSASWASLPPTRSTATWSPSLTASSMSWVTNTMVLPSSRCSRRNSSCSSARARPGRPR